MSKTTLIPGQINQYYSTNHEYTLKHSETRIAALRVLMPGKEKLYEQLHMYKLHSLKIIVHLITQKEVIFYIPVFPKRLKK